MYVFSNKNGNWAQQAYIKASNAEAGDYFGSAIDLSADGSILVVGAYAEASSATQINGDEDDNSAPQAGAVYVFTRDETSPLAVTILVLFICIRNAKLVS